MPNALIMREVKNLLAERKNVAIYVRGKSMRPFLRDGDKVTLMPACRHNVQKGMIVLAKTPWGMMLHRVIRVEKNLVVLEGDANAYQQERVDMNDVWGVVSDAHRQKRELELYSCRMCTAARIWHLLGPLKGGCLRVYEWWYEKKTRI